MENGPAFHPLDYISVLRRRMWWLITPVVLAVLVGGALILLLPRTYYTTATLGISLPTMGGQVVSESQRLTSQERVRSFNQLLKSPSVLQQVVKAEGLDKTMSMDEAMAVIGSQANVTLPAPDPNVPQGNVELFFLNYSAEEPELAARVANRLAEVFIDESSMKRTVRAEETSGFLAKRVDESKARLAKLEAELRVAKESHMGALPEQTQSNIASMTAAQNQLTAAANDLRREQDRLNTIQRDLNGLKPMVADGAAPGRQAPAISPAAMKVATLQKELAEARIQYTDKHPAIADLERELKAARAEAAAEVTAPEEQREAQLRSDPAYTGLIRERDMVNNNILYLERLQKDYREQIGRYMARVDTAPRVEQQLASLQRETEMERGRYADLVKRFNDAQIAEQVEQSRGSEHFTMIARAPVPEAPVTPLGTVPRVMALVMLLGMCLGGGLALGREYLDRSIHDARALNDLPTPVLGEIPRISHV